MQLFQSQAKSWESCPPTHTHSPTPKVSGIDSLLSDKEKSLGSDTASSSQLLFEAEIGVAPAPSLTPGLGGGEGESRQAGLQGAHVTCSVVQREAVVHHVIGPHPKTVENQAGHAEVPGVGEPRGTSAPGAWCQQGRARLPPSPQPLPAASPAIHHDGSFGQPRGAGGVDVEEFIWGAMRTQGQVLGTTATSLAAG